MKIILKLDFNELKKLYDMGMIDSMDNIQAIETAIHDMIFDRYEIEK